MHPAAQRFLEMTPQQKRSVHLYLANLALEKWQEYCRSGAPLAYVEFVAGTTQEVDVNLPIEAFVCAVVGRDMNSVEVRYQEPYCAIEEEDWALPVEMQHCYFAVYNTFQKYALGKEIDDWLIVNQSLSLLCVNPEEMLSALSDAVNQAI